MKTYSQDLRERMLGAVERGMPRRKEAVQAFGVSSLATLKRWLKRRGVGSYAALTRRPGMRPRIGAMRPRSAARCGSN
jgi:transposase